MIIREETDELVLVRQADHALLSGWLAAAWGAAPWEPPSHPEGAVLGARLHDLAWTPYDEALHRRPDGRPYPFQEVGRVVTIGFYSRGLDAVERIDPYAGLMASLHYSGFYTSHWGWRHWASHGDLEGEEREVVEGFVRQELERQRRLRERLRLEGPQEERRLRCNYVWLQLWDRISLDICRHGFHGHVEDYPATPLTAEAGAPEARLHIELRPGGDCRLDPYPLLPNPYRARVPCVLVPLAAASDPAGLEAAWLAGGGEAIEVTFRPLAA